MAKKARKPAKKKTKAAKKGLSKPKQTLIDRLPKGREEYLLLLIKFTERAINPNFPDKGMVDQAIRLKQELEELRASK